MYVIHDRIRVSIMVSTRVRMRVGVRVRVSIRVMGRVTIKLLEVGGAGRAFEHPKSKKR